MNYKKVIEDYNLGKINRKDWTVIMDNDGGDWKYTGAEKNDEVIEFWVSKMNEKYGQPDGYRDIVKVLRAANVEAEWC